MQDTTTKKWFVMRDLKRSNAKLRAYLQLSDEGFEVFTPMTWVVRQKCGRRTRKQVPVLNDLLFVHSCRDALDPIVQRTDTLQYRYVRGGTYCEAMTVRQEEMENFMAVVRACDNPRFYVPGEITPSMLGSAIRIMGGPFDGVQGRLLRVKGSRVKRLLVQIPDVLAASVEVTPDCIQLL